MRTTSRKPLVLAGAGTILALAAATVALATTPSGEAHTALARGQLLAAANVNRKVAGGRVRVKTDGALDALMLEVTLAPGGNSGWHSHVGPVISIVKQGTLTVIDAKCQRHDIPAGHAVINPGSGPSENENKDTSNPVTVDVTFLLPHSAMSPRVDQPAPAGCTA